MIHKVGRDLREEEKKLAEEFRCDDVALTTDWAHRSRWLPDILGVEDAHWFKECVVDEFQRYIDECWQVAKEERASNHPTVSATIMKNVLLAIVEKGKLLQSMGDLPRTSSSQEITVKHDDKFEVKGNQSELDIINKAAGILNKADSGKERSKPLH